MKEREEGKVKGSKSSHNSIKLTESLKQWCKQKKQKQKLKILLVNIKYT